MTRLLVLGTVVGGIVGGPYLVSKSAEVWRDGNWFASFSATETSTAAAAANPRATGVNPYAIGARNSADPASLDANRFYSLSEVLRMNITKNWVYQHWARKTTGLADPDRFGVRVPLVTGTGVADLAGSLSYYFDRSGRLVHISLRGRTGDTTQIVQLVQQRFGLQRVYHAPPGVQLYQRGVNGRVQSQLRTSTAPVLWGNSPHGSFDVELELEWPGSTRFLDVGPPVLGPLAAPPVAAAASPPATAAAAAPADDDAGSPVPVGPVPIWQQLTEQISGWVPDSESLEAAAGAAENAEIATDSLHWRRWPE